MGEMRAAYGPVQIERDPFSRCLVGVIKPRKLVLKTLFVFFPVCLLDQRRSSLLLRSSTQF